MRVGSNRQRRLAGSGGFNLVELLVVMVIIAIISAIMYPVLLKAKETARTSECLSNMREIGAGLHMYLDDYSDHFPSAVPWGAPSYWREQGLVTIQELLGRYVRNGMTNTKGEDEVYAYPGVFACPSDSGLPSEFGDALGVPASKPIWKYTGCSYEYYASDQEDSGSRDMPWTGLSPEVFIESKRVRVGAPLSAIPALSKKAVLGDTYYWHCNDRVPDGRVAWRNTLFADGHAARVRGGEHLESRLRQLRHWSPY